MITTLVNQKRVCFLVSDNSFGGIFAQITYLRRNLYDQVKKLEIYPLSFRLVESRVQTAKPMFKS